MKTRIVPLLVITIMLFQKQANAQQYVWAKNGGAAATLSSNTAISVNSADESWVVANGQSANRFFGAGAGTAPDISPLNTTGATKLVKYDANMNLLWVAGPPNSSGLTIAADPLDPTRFYMAWNVVAGAGVMYGANPVIGQAAASTLVLAHCQQVGTNSYSYIWVRKIDGTSDESAGALRVKNIGGTVKIALMGVTRSPTVTNYSDGTTGAAQSVTVPGGGGVVYDYFVSYYDGSGNPIWINKFGNDAANENNKAPIDINDDGDVLFGAGLFTTTLGTVNYVLNNNSGTAPGTTTTATYTGNANLNRFILFSFAAADGTVNWAYDKLSAPTNSAVACGLATDAAKNVYLNVQIGGTFVTGGSASSITSAGSNDIGVVVLDNAGVPIRAQRYGSAGNETITYDVHNDFVLDRVNNRLYIGGASTSAFTTGTAATQVLSGADGFILCANSTGTMAGISAVSLNGSVSGGTEYYGGINMLSNGDIVGLGQYAVSAENRVNASSTPYLPKTAYGYGDVAFTKFTGGTMMPVTEGSWGGKTSNLIAAVAMQGDKLISAGTFIGTMVVGGTTLSTSTAQNVFLAVTDTATGVITNAYQIGGNGNVSVQDIKVNPTDGSVYCLLSSSGTVTAPGGTPKGVTLSSGRGQVYIVKLNSSFVHQWTAEISGAESQNPGGLDIDPATGDVYISGLYSSPYLFWVNNSNVVSGVIATNSNTALPLSFDIFAAKFDNTGNLQWITSGGNPTNLLNDQMYRGVIYSGGSLYLGVQTATGGSIFSFGGSSFTTVATATNGNADMALIKLNGTTGSTDWIKNWGGNGNDIIRSLGAYGGNIYVAGQTSSGGAGAMNLGASGNFSTVGSDDIFVFAADAGTGDEQAIPLARIGGNGIEQVNKIDIDALGNIFYVGHTSTSVATAAFPYVTSGSADWLTGSLDANTLTSKFAFVNGSVSTEQAYSVTHGKQGMLFTGGSLLGTANYGTTTLLGSTAGDYAYARIDYPYIAPGAAISNLNAWYKTNAALTGTPATAWTNSSINTSLTTLTNTGTVPVTASGLNYNPTINVTGGTNYLSQSSIYSPNFLDASGTNYTIYSVYKPSSSTDQLLVWNESGAGTGITIGAAGNTITGTGGAKTATNTTALSTSQYNLSAITVTGGTLRNYLNGTANGTVSGVTALNTTNSGIFKIDGTGAMDVAEVVTYGLAHITGQTNMNQVNTYFGVKYGITLPHNYYSTEGDTLYKVAGGYAANIAGIGRDDNDVLDQRQSHSQNTAAKGNMLTIGLGTIAADNVSNTNTFTTPLSYLVWGDNAAGVTTTQNTDITTTASSCAYRMPREWKAQRTGTGTGPTQVTFDLNSTITLTGLTAADIQLMIDKDGDGNFTTGTSTLVNATTFTGNIVTFDNVNWDADANGSDVFTLLFNNKIPNVTLVANGITKAAPLFTCPDAGGALVFADNATAPTEKYLAVYPLGNTGYSFTTTALNNNPAINNQMKTDGVANTTALMNRMYIINDAGTNNYPSGMKVRVYYAPADSTAAVAALDPAVAGIPSFRWFKMSGTTPSGVLTAQTTTGLSSATWLNPAAYGTENGINYVEFNGITSFSTFGAMASKGATPLPVHFISAKATAEKCMVSINWEYEISSKSVPVFDVERSSNGKNYELLAAIKNGSNSYQDVPPAAGQWQYRIKAVEPGGQLTYTNNLPVQTTQCSGDMGYVYPNPASNLLIINITGEVANASYQLYDAVGRNVQTAPLFAGRNNINITSLSEGIYFIKVITGNTVKTQQIHIVR